MVRGALGAVFLLLLLLPGASAGTKEAPELSDDPGDWSPAVPAEVGGQADLLRAWVWGENPDGINVTLEVADLRSTTSATFGLGWRSGIATQFGHSGGVYWGPRVEIDAGSPRWGYVQGTGDTQLSQAVMTRLDDAHGRLAFGTPGNITWYLQREGESYSSFLQDNYFMDRFIGYSSTLRPNAGIGTRGLVTDSAATSGTKYVVGLNRLRDVASMPAPVREPDLTRDTATSYSWSSDAPPAVTLRGLFVDVYNGTIELTTRVDTLSAEEISECASGAAFEASVSGGSSHLSASGVLKALGEEIKVVGGRGPGERREQSVDHVAVAAGTPGYVRLRMNAPYWDGGADLTQISYHATARCDHRYTMMGYDPGFEIPSAGALSVAALAVLAAIARRRGR